MSEEEKRDYMEIWNLARMGEGKLGLREFREIQRDLLKQGYESTLTFDMTNEIPTFEIKIMKLDPNRSLFRKIIERIYLWII